MITGTYEISVCVAKDIPHTVEFFLQDGVMKGIHTNDNGKQMIEDITWTDWSVSWESYSGSENLELFRNVLLLDPETQEVRGYAVGAAPYFRGFTPLRGRKIAEGEPT